MNSFRVLKLFVRALMKLVGITTQKIEIEPGTTMNFWGPTEKLIIKNTKDPNYQTVTRPSVVFLHGFFSDGILTWVFQVLALIAKYDVYVPDLLFFGDSTTDKSDRSISFQAECLAKGLRKLGVKKCTVVGFSYGGIVGLNLARLHPELVESMIISGTPVELDGSILSSLSMLLPETVEGLRLLLSIGSHNKLLTSFPNFVYRDFLEAMYSHRKERAEILNALVDDGLSPAKYSQKLHLLWAENDKFVNLDTAYHIKGQLGDETTLQYISKAGHIVHLERPWLYNHHLKRILASLYT